MLESITKKSGKSFLLRLFGLDRKKKFSLIVLMKFSRDSWTHFKEPFKTVNLLISSFSNFLRNDDVVVVVVFGVGRAVAFLSN